MQLYLSLISILFVESLSILFDISLEDEFLILPIIPYKEESLSIFPSPKHFQVTKLPMGKVLSFDSHISIQVLHNTNENEAETNSLINSVNRFMKRYKRYAIDKLDDKQIELIYITSIKCVISESPPNVSQYLHSSATQSTSTSSSSSQIDSISPQEWQSEEDYLIYLGEGGGQNENQIEKFNPESTRKLSLTIHSMHPRGIVLGLGTYGQMVHGRWTTQLVDYIYDYPTHSWRGLLVDVSRHYLPIDSLTKIIDTMEVITYCILLIVVIIMISYFHI